MRCSRCLIYPLPLRLPLQNIINPSAIASLVDISKTAVDVVHKHLEIMDCVDGQASQSHIEEEEEMSPEMVAFFKVSLDHRKQREKQRQLEEKEKKKQHNSDKTWLNEEEPEYILASDIGIHGTNKQTVQSPNKQQEVEEYKHKMRKIYGNDAEKIMAMEMAHDFKFNQHMGKHNPVSGLTSQSALPRIVKMEQVELKTENTCVAKEQEQTVSDNHRMKALMCPEPGCQTFSLFDQIFLRPHYQVWLDSLKKTNSGEFSTQRPAQAHPDGSMSGTLYCSQTEKNKNTALSMNSAMNNFDRGCAAHVNFEVKSDRSVVVRAQLAHCGHEVLQIALSALGSRKEVAVKLEELLALYTSVREKLDATMVSASLNWFEIPKMEVVMRMVEEAASNMYYARGIVDEIQSFYQKNPDSRNSPIMTMNQTRSSFVPSIRFQVGEKKRGRPTNAANAHKIAKIRLVSGDSGEVSLEDSGFQPLLIQDEGEQTENVENIPVVDQIIHPRFVANVSDETIEKIDSPQQNLPLRVSLMVVLSVRDAQEF
uniref:Uncharacterized protein n=1 Tax=Ditylenchus dipsaci TaxID=166011 RepID=A0A915DZV8_9BILA